MYVCTSYACHCAVSIAVNSFSPPLTGARCMFVLAGVTHDVPTNTIASDMQFLHRYCFEHFAVVS